MPVGGYVPVPLEPQFEEFHPLDSVEGVSQVKENVPGNAFLFSLDYYKSYFDVDTYQVVQRVISGLIPFSKRFSLSASLRPAPDLYGPFWIIITLVFSIAFSGSIYEYIISKNASVLSTFNFGRVTISAAVLFVYWCLMPIVVTSLVWFRRRKAFSDAQGIDKGPEFTFGSLFSELLAIYGYSMVSFIPVAMLLCVPVSLIQWILIGVASLVSLCVLGSATWPIFKQKTKQLAIGLLVLIIVAHIAMTVSLSVVFFHQPPLEPQPKPAPAVQPADAGVPNKLGPQESVQGGGAGNQKDTQPKETPIKPVEDNPNKKVEKDNPKVA
uniref:Protein YIPF n=1 Tax=Echinococcus granulosus TaxID=6210 RepID=A0A068WLI5_ECHGR|nr:Yip1 domain [Echinococcus granulosus]